MADYFVLVIDPMPGKAVPYDAIKEHLDSFKDWLKCSPHAWLIYSNRSAAEIRDGVRTVTIETDPAVIVFPLQMEGWASYSTDVVQKWIRRDRSDDLMGD